MSGKISIFASFRKDRQMGLEYNTQREKLKMPAYGRTIQRMIEETRQIPDREKRCAQAAAILKSMEILNPAVYTQDNYSQMLWDHMQFIADYCLDVDSEFPMPQPAALQEKPQIVPVIKKPVKAAHYGRNIESIIDLIASLEDSPTKTEMIRSLAIYMRQQYLIWNKDFVEDETIFKDLEKLSDFRIKVPEGLSLTSLSSEMNFSRPDFSPKQSGGKRTNNNNRRNRKK